MHRHIGSVSRECVMGIRSGTSCWRNCRSVSRLSVSYSLVLLSFLQIGPLGSAAFAEVTAQRSPARGRLFTFDLQTCAGLSKLKPTTFPQLGQITQVRCDGVARTDRSPGAITASYTGLELDGVPHTMCASFSFSAAATEGAAAVLISNKGGLDTVENITQDGAMHLVFTARNAQVTSFESGRYRILGTIEYDRPIVNDGYSVYWACVFISPYDVTLLLPDGRTQVLPISSYARYGGRFAQFESFTNSRDGSLITFHSVIFVTG